jgi:glyoxylase-like metal-dependent hydrolase (beta-lactamase superfamily II)
VVSVERPARYLSGMSQSPPPIGVTIVPVTPLQQNCTIIWCETTKKAAIIDPGGSVDVLLEVVKRRELTLDAIWITHGHLDHAGGAAELQEKTGLDIIGPHEADQFWIDQIPENGLRYGVAGCRSFTPTRWLDDGDVLTLGETTWEVFHCPGHTPGHVIFFNREARFAQVGDVLFQGSIGRTDFPRSDHGALLNAITTKLWPLGDDVTFIPGHGPHSTFGAERRGNPFVSDAAMSRAPIARPATGPS